MLRGIVVGSGTMVLGPLAASCDAGGVIRSAPFVGSYADGRLSARPHAPSAAPAEPGRSEVEIGGHRALLYVPQTYTPERAMPFAVLLHGASGRAEGGFRIWASFAEQAGIVLLAPEANGGGAWDVMMMDFGPDAAMIDEMLEWSFDRIAVDASRLIVGGFSNGATYSLSLGLTNGDLFSRVVAISPGGMSPDGFHGRPPVFIAHGVDDETLPIDQTSRQIVPELRSVGYDVRYLEFEGRHRLEPAIARRALAWSLGAGAGDVSSGSL